MSNNSESVICKNTQTDLPSQAIKSLPPLSQCHTMTSNFLRLGLWKFLFQLRQCLWNLSHHFAQHKIWNIWNIDPGKTFPPYQDGNNKVKPLMKLNLKMLRDSTRVAIKKVYSSSETINASSTKTGKHPKLL